MVGCGISPVRSWSRLPTTSSGSGFVVRQPSLRVQRRRAAGAGGGDRLPVGPVHHVARREHALDAGPGAPLLDDQVPLRVGGELPGAQLAARVMADRDEYT